jgi:hypothetical protein
MEKMKGQEQDVVFAVGQARPPSAKQSSKTAPARLKQR